MSGANIILHHLLPLWDYTTTYCHGRFRLSVMQSLTLLSHKAWKLAWWSIRNTHKASIPASHCLCLITCKADILTFFYLLDVILAKSEVGAQGGELITGGTQRVRRLNRLQSVSDRRHTQWWFMWWRVVGVSLYTVQQLPSWWHADGTSVIH